MSNSRKNLLELSGPKAKKFLLKPSSYFNAKLPNYIDLSKGLDVAIDRLADTTISDLTIDKESLSSSVDVNHKILANKDGNYAWRPLQILHPLVYVDLVKEITKNNNWKTIRKKFKDFQSDERIKCISLPIVSTSSKSDTAETILNWWENLEQSQIMYALDFAYCIHTDITDCYSSIYTHSIPWALHTKAWAKTHRKTNCIGNNIDKRIQWLQNGQTNGIPQGSILMDLIAEMVLGYADTILLKKIDLVKIIDFKILRYRDDYRIFSAKKDDAEIIIKLLSDILAELNLKLNSNKTFLSNDLVLDAIKQDKIYWDIQYASFTQKVNKKTEFKISIQKHLIQIKILGDKYPNCGSLGKSLTNLYKLRIASLEKEPTDIYQLISIIVDIMQNNPRTVEICIAILGKLFEFIDSNKVDSFIDKIIKKFENTPNTDIVEIWLQKLSLLNNRDKEFNSIVCQKVAHPNEVSLWNSEWLKNRFNESEIIDENIIDNLNLITPIEEIDLFNENYTN